MLNEEIEPTACSSRHPIPPTVGLSSWLKRFHFTDFCLCSLYPLVTCKGTKEHCFSTSLWDSVRKEEKGSLFKTKATFIGKSVLTTGKKQRSGHGATPLWSALRRQEYKFEVSLGSMVKACGKKQTSKTIRRNWLKMGGQKENGGDNIMKVACFHSWAHCEGSGVAHRIQGGHCGVFLKSQHLGGGSRRIKGTKLSLSTSQVQGPHRFSETWLKMAQSIRGSVGEVKGLVSCLPGCWFFFVFIPQLVKGFEGSKTTFSIFSLLSQFIFIHKWHYNSNRGNLEYGK